MDEQNGLIRMVIPITGDTTLFSQSSNQTNPGKIEALPHNSIEQYGGLQTKELYIVLLLHLKIQGFQS